MKLINRYIYAVTKHLSAEIREDVSKELHTNIEDMLPDNPTELDIRGVLEQLGNPYKLANEYHQTKKYIIGPNLYDRYLTILKLVVGIVPSVFASIALLEGIFTSSIDTGFFETSLNIIVSILVAVLQGITQAFLWVTIVFIILERSEVIGEHLPFAKKQWSIDDLPKIPVADKMKISRGETIFSMVCTIFFVALINTAPQLIGIYEKSNNGLTLVEPLLLARQLDYYMYVIIIFAIAQLGIFTYKLILMHWSIPLAIVNAVYNTALSVLSYVMLTDQSLVNPDFITYISKLFQSPNFQTIDMWWSNSKIIFIVIFIGLNLWDSITGLYKCKRTI